MCIRGLRICQYYVTLPLIRVQIKFINIKKIPESFPTHFLHISAGQLDGERWINDRLWFVCASDEHQTLPRRYHRGKF